MARVNNSKAMAIATLAHTGSLLAIQKPSAMNPMSATLLITASPSYPKLTVTAR